jgi:hypothetical protein
MFDPEKTRLEIQERNRIRAVAQLPAVSVTTELRRLYDVQRESEFDHFYRTSPLRKRVEQKLLNRARRLRNDPNWKPSGVLSGGGLAFYAQTRNLMRRIWRQRDRLTWSLC